MDPKKKPVEPKVKQPEKKDPIKEMLDKSDTPYILIRLPSTSLLAKDHTPGENTSVETNLIPEMFSSTIVRLAITLQTPQQPQNPNIKREG